MRSYLGSVVVLLLIAGAAMGEKFSPDRRLFSGNEPIEAPSFNCITLYVGDFDGDGLQDLLVGETSPGRLRIYRNRGTKESPRFNGFEWFRVRGEIAELPLGGRFRPQLVDVDGDGDTDVVSESSSGTMFWYQRQSAQEFSDAELLMFAQGDVLCSGYSSASHIADWDSDGDQDVLVFGKMDDKPALQLIENTGSALPRSFAAPQTLPFSDVLMQNQIPYAKPCMADWDGDGDQDLLLGLWNGNIMLCENVAGGGLPNLARPRMLLSNELNLQPRDDENVVDDEDGEVVRRGRGGEFCVADLNNDGRLDLVIGDQRQEVFSPDPDIEEQLKAVRNEAVNVATDFRRVRRFAKRLAQNQQKQRELALGSRKSLAERLTNLNQQIADLEASKYPPRQSRGNVWLYLREK